MNNAAGFETSRERRFHGHLVRGPEGAMHLFSRLATATHSHLLREAQHYGVTQVVLDQRPWELVFLADHTFELRRPHEQRWL